MMRSHPQVKAWMLAALLCGAAPAGAVTINSSFESGTSGWTIVGDVSVVDSTFGVTPTDGTSQLLMTTGGSAVRRRRTERAMGLPNRTIQDLFENQIPNPGESTGSGPTEGSAIQQSFDAEVGDILTFDWNFLTDEFTADPAQPDIFTDFLWGYLEGPSSNQESVLAHVNQQPSPFDPFGSGSTFNDETGYQTFTFTFVEAGTYTLTLGVHDLEDRMNDSGVVFDFFRLIKGPEPNTFLLVAGGLLGLNWYARRHKAPR